MNIPIPNLKQVVPLFMVKNIEDYLTFYGAGFGLDVKPKWLHEGTARKYKAFRVEKVLRVLT